MKKTVCGWIITVLLLTSCSQPKQEPLVISTDVWIGAAILYYAREEGWLKEADIQMLQARSINENIQFFESGASDIFTGTQHEYKREKSIRPDLIPIFIYDRSYGGDVVMANRTLEQLRRSEEKIDVYLEADSVGEELFEYLTQFEGIAKERLVRHSRTQDEISTISAAAETSPKIVITYNPHDLALKKSGFVEIASSKDDRYLVIDAVYVSSKLYHKYPERFAQLRSALERSLRAYDTNPKAFYEKVKIYLGNPSYDEFMQMRRNIQWIDNKPSKEMQKRLEEIQFPIKEITG